MELAPALVRQRLEPQERVLWWGQPKGGVRFRMHDLFLVPFSLLWGGGVIYGHATALLHGQSLPSLLFGIPFIVLGLHLMIGRFLLDIWRRARTYYAVTQKRILILTRSSLKSVELRQLSEVSLQESRDGSGSLAFGPQPGIWPRKNDFSAWGGAPTVPTFEWVADAAQVHATVRRAQAALERAG